MHAPSAGSTQHYTSSSIEAEPVKVRVTVFAIGTHFADTNLVAHHFDGLLADQRVSENNSGTVKQFKKRVL